MSLTDRIAELETELSKLRTEAAATGIPVGPGIGFTPTAPTAPWHRLPGAPYVPGENAADNPARAKQLAAQGIRVDGSPGSVQGADREYALDIADTIADDMTTATEADGYVEGAGECDKDSVIYQVILGQFNGSLKAGPGGRARLMFPHTRLADVIKQPGKPVGGNVA